jgi:hypothetical protein
MPPVSFPILVGARSWGILRLFGVRRHLPPTVRLDGAREGELDVEFGRFRFRTPVANIVSWRIEGPWRWITAIGVRRSVRHGDVSFAGSPRGGVRVDFRDRVRWGIFRVPAIYLGAEDLEGLAAELERRGIPGVDARRDARRKD